MKKALIVFALTACLSTGLAAQEPAARTAQDEGVATVQSEETRREFAAATHELILTRLAEGNYEAVLPEYRKILALDMAGGFESLVTEGAWVIVEDLREAGRYELALKIIDETLTRVSGVDNRFDLLILKGKTYKDKGDYVKAIETLEQARRLRPDSGNRDKN